VLDHLNRSPVDADDGRPQMATGTDSSGVLPLRAVVDLSAAGLADDYGGNGSSQPDGQDQSPSPECQVSESE
jgi:hypothetical protein